MKRRMGIFFLTVALIAIVGSGTLAFTPRTYTANNVITTGSIDFVIRDTTENHNILTEGKTYSDLMPGDTIYDGFNIFNDCGSFMYIRVKPEVTINDPDLETDCITVDLDDREEKKNVSRNWEKKDDGYYYYRNQDKGQYYFYDQEDINFFYKMHLDGKTMEPKYLGKEISVKLTVDAVQGYDNWQRLGWPTTN